MVKVECFFLSFFTSLYIPRQSGIIHKEMKAVLFSFGVLNLHMSNCSVNFQTQMGYNVLVMRWGKEEMGWVCIMSMIRPNFVVRSSFIVLVLGPKPCKAFFLFVSPFVLNDRFSPI